LKNKHNTRTSFNATYYYNNSYHIVFIDNLITNKHNESIKERETMSDKKPDLKVIGNKKDNDLTIKQRSFINEIVKGKLGSHKAAYAKAYDVTLNKDKSITKWCEVEASKLLSSPKISISLQRALERKEQNVTASALRTKNYVLSKLLEESQNKENSSSSRIRAIELLGKSIALFTDATMEHPSNRSPQDIEQDIETKLEQLLASNE